MPDTKLATPKGGLPHFSMPPAGSPSSYELDRGRRALYGSLLLVAFVLMAFTPYFSPNWHTQLHAAGRSHEIPNLYSITLEEVQNGLQKGLYDSQDLTRAYLARIAEVNDDLHVVIETNPHALIEAKQADELRKRSGRPLSPFHGVPILVKDIIATARLDQTYMNTTAGSYALLGSIPSRESTVAAKLRAGGAIILGKTNLSQWSGCRGKNIPSGWSARGGQVTGVYVKNQNPGGSSSGSGVAATLGLSFAAIGSETSGSIIIPSQYSTLCGIKPTVGLVSRSMVIPLSFTQDTIGPMAHDCKTAAALLSVIAGKDIAQDPATAAIPFEKIPDYAKACTKDGLKGARIGVPSAFVVSQALDPVIWAAFNNTFDIMRNSGADLNLEANFPALQAFLENQAALRVLFPEVATGVKNYFDQLYFNPNNVTDLMKLAAYTEQEPKEGYPDKDIGTWKSMFNESLTLDSDDYRRARAEDAWLGSSGTLLGSMDKYDLDALVVPTVIAYGVAAIAGYPVINVPMGFYPPGTPVTYDRTGVLIDKAPNVPFGLSFIGRRFSEEKLVAYACAFEAATQVRNKGPLPYILPKTNLKDVLGE